MRPEEARTKLIQAALRCLQADLADEHAHAADECQYADEQLALAARDLARAIDALPAHKRPVGWTEALPQHGAIAEAMERLRRQPADPDNDHRFDQAGKSGYEL